MSDLDTTSIIPGPGGQPPPSTNLSPVTITAILAALQNITPALYALAQAFKAGQTSDPAPAAPVPMADAPPVALASWTPADASGAGLLFTGVSGATSQTCGIVTVFGSLTYPINIDPSQATIGLPEVAADQGYAQAPAAIYAPGATTLMLLVPVPGINRAKFVRADSGAPITNAMLSGLSISFMAQYPAN